MIRVLHSVSNMDRAGIETNIMNYYRHIDRDKIQFDFWANKSKPGAYEDEIEKMGGRVFRSPGLNPLRFPKYVKAMRKILRENPDIKIVHVHNGPLGLYSLVAAKLCGVRLRVYHAHSTRVPPDKALPLKLICKPLVKYAAVKRLACGEKSARFYYGNGMVDKGMCVIVRNAIEPRRFAYNEETRANMRSRYGLDENVVIGHVGRMTHAKNHKRMLDIFKAFLKSEPKAVLVLLGDGELEQSVRAHAKELGFTDKEVRFMGNVPNVWEWYQAMDAFLMPSVFEGQPVVGIEAQAAGLACILSDAISSETKITDLMRFVSLKKDNDEWAREIADAITKTGKRRDTSDEIRKAGFDIAIEAPRLQALYESYVSESKA